MTITTALPEKRPLRILLSYSMDAATVSPAYADELHSLAANAGRTLTAAADDTQVVYVDATNPMALADNFVRRYDAVVILGGADMDPARYGGTRDDRAASHGVDTEADEFEISLVLAAREAQIPLLGICRGLQVVNVALGGSLISDVGDSGMHNDHPSFKLMVDHDVEISEGSRLAQILGIGKLPTRSAHHQGISRASDQVKVTARAEDGLIEAVEATDDWWMIAVQWHPEEKCARVDDFAALCDALINAARNSRALRTSSDKHLDAAHSL